MKHIILNSKSKLFFLFMLFFILLIEFIWTPSFDNVVISDAEAVVGRPASPGSVAGVRRRTTRRTVRRRHIAAGTRVVVLPSGCTTVVKYSVEYHYCDGTYYRPYYEGNEVVYVVEEP